jgi:hypothetical protein
MVAGYDEPFEKPTRIPVEPRTTWSFVTMSPRRSMTNPEPSAPTFSVEPGVKNVGGICCVCVSVMTTTPGAASR